MLTSRDMQTIEFLEQYKIARTTTIAKILYPSLRVAQRRLKVLFDAKEVKRYADAETDEFIYFIKKPKQVLHSLLVTEFYRYMIENYNVEKFKIEVELDTIRPDAMFRYNNNGKKYLGVLEVEISNNGTTPEKYDTYKDVELQAWFIKRGGTNFYKNFSLEKI